MYVWMRGAFRSRNSGQTSANQLCCQIPTKTSSASNRNAFAYWLSPIIVIIVIIFFTDDWQVIILIMWVDRYLKKVSYVCLLALSKIFFAWNFWCSWFQGVKIHVLHITKVTTFHTHVYCQDFISVWFFYFCHHKINFNYTNKMALFKLLTLYLCFADYSFKALWCIQFFTSWVLKM